MKMSSPSASSTRIKTDVMKLIESKHNVTVKGRHLNEFEVMFNGPSGTAYAEGVWKVRVHLPNKYPFKSPSIGFVNKIFHPNIDETSGTVCLDVINEAWTALYDLSNIFDSFLPQLLTYPNAIDPLNANAAKLFLNNMEEFNRTVCEYIKRFATADALRASQSKQESDDSASSMSDYDQEDNDDEI